VNSKATNNSQTIHCGDFETNKQARKGAASEAHHRDDRG